MEDLTWNPPNHIKSDTVAHICNPSPAVRRREEENPHESIGQLVCAATHENTEILISNRGKSKD